MDTEIALLFAAGGGLLLRRRHPTLMAKLDRLLADGRILSPLPGVLAVGELQTPEQRIAAGALWAGPDAIVAGLAAARLTFWPDCRLDHVELWTAGRARRQRPGWVVRERRPPAELVGQRGPVRFTCPALTAVELAAGPLGGEAIDRALRTRSATLAQMRRALELLPSRRGNISRAKLLEDSRDEPWSEAERELHRMLRAAGISGWCTNVWIGGGVPNCFADICFQASRLIIEVDGYATHGNRHAFESDRRRRNALVLAGYTVLNFTWRQLIDDPEWVIGCVRHALGLSRTEPLADLFKTAATRSGTITA